MSSLNSVIMIGKDTNPIEQESNKNSPLKLKNRQVYNSQNFNLTSNLIGIKNASTTNLFKKPYYENNNSEKNLNNDRLPPIIKLKNDFFIGGKNITNQKRNDYNLLNDEKMNFNGNSVKLQKEPIGSNKSTIILKKYNKEQTNFKFNDFIKNSSRSSGRKFTIKDFFVDK